MIPEDETLLTQYLARRDVPCPRCGYNLRDATSDACPECGDRLQLQVALVEPRLAAFVTTIVAISIGLGGSALFSLIAVLEAPGGWWRELVAWLLLGQLALTALALPTILLSRRRIRRAGRLARWIIATLACLLVLGLWIAIVVTFED